MKTSRRSTPLSARVLALVCALALCASGRAAAQTVNVRVDRPGAPVPSTLIGLFFEDINFGADGGLYPERVKNRSFEFPDPLMGWKRLNPGGSKGTLQIYDRGTERDDPNAHYLRIKVDEPGGGFGAVNEGFRGIGIEKGKEYVFSVTARTAGGAAVALRVELVDAQGRSLGRAQVRGFGPRWRKHTATLRASETEAKARLNLLVEDAGALDVDLVSLFPKETWNNRPNGLRPDLVKLLKEMRPGFLRFPGGCIVEGRYLEQRYQWKKTVADLEDRPVLVNRWNTEFRHRPTPDYFQSFGLGYYEYFLLSEDLGAEPLPILNCGMACQYNSGELAALEDLGHFIQDAVDLIEFANAPARTPWGRRRAAMGHPAPFNLKMIGIGNEQWGPQYVERYKEFARVLKAKYPNVTLVSSAGPNPDGPEFEYLWKSLRGLKAELIDEHYYRPPAWFRDNAGRYDDYPRDGPKVFAGEYAAQSVRIASPDNRNDWETALSEAAFVTGLERNADVVSLSSYAPLFGHVEAWQWTPNLIWFDNLRAYATPNYYVQKLFSTNRGTRLLPVLLDGSAKNGRGDLYASATLDERAGEVVLKLVNTSGSSREIRVELAGARTVNRPGRAFVLTAPDLKAENSLQEPTKIAPVETPLAVASGEFTHTLAPHSLTVLRVSVAAR
ncbi:MAG TPA: alpha-L-arabinofuranosidase C-terminal domain-containing protein [Pyrinomonadaceae bacterium]|nr:alpha-L-arabinofuranosidase C-terminal domain-containing protein [Pyrinomonadaceae bacterium]